MKKKKLLAWTDYHVIVIPVLEVLGDDGEGLREAQYAARKALGVREAFADWVNWQLLDGPVTVEVR